MEIVQTLLSDTKFKDQLAKNLADTDEFAVANVNSGRGGPFGAMFHLYNIKTGRFTEVGSLRANAVLKTGSSAAHAEDQAMDEDQIRDLKIMLKENANQIDNLVVVLSSSGESFPACHAKEQILAHNLVEEGLLIPKRFIVTYGATYDETAEVAGFHDKPYFEDFAKDSSERMINVSSRSIQDLPIEVSKIFNTASEAVAVVCADGIDMTIGRDQRDSLNLFRTPENVAILNANTAKKLALNGNPFNLGNATLYTTTKDIGPLTYAACQWAGVAHIVNVKEGTPPAPEASGISNKEFFEVVGHQTYGHDASAITIVKIDNFANKAQWAWNERNKQGNAIVYNGLDAN